jgi:hypothetical protein
MSDQPANHPSTQPQKYFVSLQDSPSDFGECRSVVVTAADWPAAKAKALRTPIAKTHPKVVYWLTAADVEQSIEFLRKELAQNTAKLAFCCLVQDCADNLFEVVNVTASDWNPARQAAIDARKADYKLTAREGDCNFKVIHMWAMTNLEALLKELSPKRMSKRQHPPAAQSE